MKNQTLGMMIASLRKEHGMTQLELAEKMHVTDKASPNGKGISAVPISILCQSLPKYSVCPSTN